MVKCVTSWFDNLFLGSEELAEDRVQNGVRSLSKSPLTGNNSEKVVAFAPKVGQRGPGGVT